MERQEVLQQKLEHWCAASIRALAADPSVKYRGHHLYLDQQPVAVHSPYLQLNLETREPRKLRGVADAIALRLRFSDRDLHQRLAPIDTLANLVFELLEQLRCESLAPEHLPGIRVNLRNRFIYWAELAATSKLTENNIGLLIYSLLCTCWSRLLNEVIPEQIDAEIEATRMGLASRIGAQLYAFKALRYDQTAFSEQTLKIAAIISDMAGVEAAVKEDSQDADKMLSKLLKTSGLSTLSLTGNNASWQKNSSVAEAQAIGSLSEKSEYRIFTRAYDQQVEADKTIRTEQLKKLRKRLDKRVRQQNINVQRVAGHLQLLLDQPKLSGWSFGEEQGYLDSARLARLVSAPHDHRLFRQETYKPASDCVVTMLVDNSGSMTYHSETIAALVDTLSRAMELASIKSEILGFTTGEWNGGQVQKDWIAAGKPTNPGRLNSLQHTIYKTADTPWRRARPAIAGMLKSELFREGIDGEALQWAAQRISQRNEQKKIILVISDGSPMDSATHKANQDGYLDKHLAWMANDIEQNGQVKLCGLGVGLDLSTYYSSSLAITLDNELSSKDFFSIAELLMS